MNRARTAAIGLLCLAAAVVLHAEQDKRFEPLSVDRPELLYVRSGAAMTRLALGYDPAVADLYWIRALQHFGRERLAPPEHVRTYALLYPMLDLTTTLDPYFTIAYRFGAIFLGEPYPGGPGRPDLAIGLLEKGLAAQPTKWQYMQDLGFVYYWHLQDFHSAASWFQRASQVPGAPSWLGPLAAVTLAEGGNRNASRALFEQIARSEEPWLRASAAQRLLQLKAMDAIDVLEARIREYRAARPNAPVTWDQLRAAGYVRGIPVDPTGVPFVILPEARVTVARESRLWPLPGQLRNQAQ